MYPRRHDLDSRLEKDLLEAQTVINLGKKNTVAHKKALTTIENVKKVYAVQKSWKADWNKVVGGRGKWAKLRNWEEKEVKFVNDEMDGGEFMNVGGYWVVDWVGIARKGNKRGDLKGRTPKSIRDCVISRKLVHI